MRMVAPPARNSPAPLSMIPHTRISVRLHMSGKALYKSSILSQFDYDALEYVEDLNLILVLMFMVVD